VADELKRKVRAKVNEQAHMSSAKKKTPQSVCNSTGPRLLTLKGAAEYLGLTIWAIRERIWAGQIPVVRFPKGRKMYLDRLDLDNFIQRNKTTIT